MVIHSQIEIEHHVDIWGGYNLSSIEFWSQYLTNFSHMIRHCKACACSTTCMRTQILVRSPNLEKHHELFPTWHPLYHVGDFSLLSFAEGFHLILEEHNCSFDHIFIKKYRVKLVLSHCAIVMPCCLLPNDQSQMLFVSSAMCDIFYRVNSYNMRLVNSVFPFLDNFNPLDIVIGQS